MNASSLVLPVDWVIANDIPGDFTFDSWFTHKDNLNYIHGLERGKYLLGDWIGTAAFCVGVYPLTLDREILEDAAKLSAEDLS